MGNNMGGGSSKAAKIMKINGELFKFKVPAKVFDIIKEYPDHILLDSEDFLRYNLRAKPLNPEDELKPRKIYLLVELPKFPDNNSNHINHQSPLRRVRSGVLAPITTTNRDLMMKKVSRRSVSDLTIMTRSTGRSFITDSDDDSGGGSLGGSPVGPTRLKLRLPKAQVLKIMEESGDDDAEAAKKIVQLCLEDKTTAHGGVTTVLEEEKESVEEAEIERHYKDVHGIMCSPCYSYRRKYRKLIS